MKILVVVFMLLIPASVIGQTISPPITEAKIDKKGRVNGDLTLQNDTLYPEVVIVEAKLVHKQPDGSIIFIDIPDTIKLTLSDMSSTLYPKSSKTITYRLEGLTDQTHVMLFASFNTQQKTDDGLKIVLKLGASIYACRITKGCRLSVLRSEGIDPNPGTH